MFIEFHNFVKSVSAKLNCLKMLRKNIIYTLSVVYSCGFVCMYLVFLIACDICCIIHFGFPCARRTNTSPK